MRKLLSTREAADFLGISRIAVFKKIRRGRLAARMIGGGYVITQGAVAAEKRYMERCEELPRMRGKAKRA